MNTLIRRFMRPFTITALAIALVSWAIMSVWTVVGQQHDEHATLAAASTAIRKIFADISPHDIPSHIDALQENLQSWELTAAAYDEQGKFIAGNAALRNDGLPAGRDLAPPSGRQLSVVPIRDGYILLARDPQAIQSLRYSMAVELAVVVAVAVFIAWLIAFPWARACWQTLTQARDDFRSIAAGQNHKPVQLVNHPLVGEVFTAAAAAIERLLAAVNERTTAEDRMRTFLADAGHELRTPLAIAVGYLGILKRNAGNDPALIERIAPDIALEHERLTRLVERILHLARLDAIAADMGASTDVARTVHEAIALVRPLDPYREFLFTPEMLPRAAIATDDLRDALRNLLENAVRYAPGSRIEVSIQTVADRISLSVRDDGPGMDAFTAAHAFDRFFRGADRGEIAGTGLGLAIVQRIAQRVGGSVRLQSAPGQGSLIELLLPRVE